MNKPAQDALVNISALDALGTIEKVVQRNVQLEKENKRLKGRLRSEAGAKSRLRRQLRDRS